MSSTGTCQHNVYSFPSPCPLCYPGIGDESAIVAQRRQLLEAADEIATLKPETKGEGTP